MAKPISFILSILVTLTLIAAMYALIKMKDPELDKAEGFKLPKFTYVAKNEDVQTITPKPARPDEVQEQPEVPDTKIVPDRVDINSELGLGAVKVGINRDLKGFNSNDGEFLPIFRAPPIFPRRALERGICGWVELSYTVTSAGTVTDAIVVKSSSSMFERNAVKAAEKYKYKPRQVGGKPVDVEGVQILISFNVEGQDC
ncbi:MAG: protein TonB [Arenicella sp.]|jgi:protein TonB